jgi:hypothetical protein
MYPSLLFSAALIAPAAPVPRDAVPNPTGPAPRVLALKADDGGAVRVSGTIPTKVTVSNTFFVIEQVVENGQTVQKQVQKQVEQDVVTSQYFDKSLADFNGTFATAAGTPLTLDEVTSRVKGGATVLASADGKPVAKTWLKAVDPDTIVMVADGLSHAQVHAVGGVLPSTPMPVPTMLCADETGKVQAPCTSAPLNANGADFNDGAFAGRVVRGRGGFRPIDPFGPQQMNAKVVHKPIADVAFEAYERSGKRVPRGEALKRLAAGGMVLVAGDNRMPDEAYLKVFHPDTIVLVGADLVLPVVPIDQTRKKESEKGPAAPAAGQAPAVKPGVVIKGGPLKKAAPPAPPELN